MPITLNRYLTHGPHPQHAEWTFFVKRTRPGSHEEEMIYQPLSHEVVVQIYREIIGAPPASGLEWTNVLDKWDRLEPRLRAEIEKRVNPE